VKCSICDGVLSLSVITITTYSGLTRTVTLCHACQDKLWGTAVTERVQRLARAAGWTQDRLPDF
jgi:hypothetical protein